MAKQAAKPNNINPSRTVQPARGGSSNSAHSSTGHSSVNQNNNPNIEINVDDEESPNKRQKTYFIYEPFDSNLAGKNVFNPNFSFSPISLTKLENFDVEASSAKLNLNLTFLDIQIMRIITANNDPANVYSRRGRVQNPTRTFKRLILARCSCYKNEEEQNRLVYLMEARNQNTQLWSNNIQYRDNGAISVGSYLRIPGPYPIDTYMKNDIPMINSAFPLVLLKPPTKFTEIPINERIESDTSYAFVYIRTQLSFTIINPVKTTCSGKFCDRQRISDWNNSKGCGCYGMLDNATSLAFEHGITVQTLTDGTLHMSSFSSLKFQQLYMKGSLPGSTKLHQLHINDTFFEILGCIYKCIQFINENGGFVTFGWYKRGVINDKSLIAKDNNHHGNNNDEELHVDAGEISYHIAHMVPTNTDLLDITTDLGMKLEEMKYDADNLNTE